MHKLLLLIVFMFFCINFVYSSENVKIKEKYYWLVETEENVQDVNYWKKNMPFRKIDILFYGEPRPESMMIIGFIKVSGEKK